MNIKQASKQSGVSAPNIRFYEKEGLLNPARLPGNDYRDYTEQDIRTLRFIRMLRMLDVPLPVIRSVLAGDASLGSVLREQKTALEQRAKQLEGAARFCAELARQDPSVASLDVDACLSRMEKPAVQGAFCSGWLQDYRTLAQVQHQRHFPLFRRAASTPRRSSQRPCRPTQRPTGCSSALKKRGCTRSFRWMAFRIKLTETRASTGMKSAAMPCIPSSLTPGFPPGGKSCCASRVSCCRRCAPLPPSWRQGG